MNLSEHLEQLSREELKEVTIKMAEYAKLDLNAEIESDCSGHVGDCGVCVNHVWISC